MRYPPGLSSVVYGSTHDVQRPTHPRLHIRDAHDAHVVFEAVRLGILRPVARRLNDAERMSICSGSIFVWEESDDELGLKRWTDGLMWSASRMREPFLFYEARPKSSSVRRHRSPDSQRGDDPAFGVDMGERSVSGLVKQTYSAIVVLPGAQDETRRRKWHLTAYFTHSDFPNLPTVQHDYALHKIVVPPGLYRSGKSRQSVRSMEQEFTDISAADYKRSLGPPSSPTQYSPAYSYHSPGSPHSTTSSAPYTPAQSPPVHRVSLPSPSRRPLSSHPSYAPHDVAPPASYPHYAPHPSAHSPAQTLPSIHTAFSSPQYPSSPDRGQDSSRAPEDERIIRLLNARSVGFS
ncbi:hypothetical protein BOTBODRAFT_120595 [Botryobasidium botryosum FD-172 SS1]|uniref:cAMP-independent regulatory protein pac2 n=1 Tax=Botryobasidium botryosum (strain FD-172 SS1) TaxID=930990 RepID=A0A067M5B2_BOTB1|nr:hypothetical protein BOTBODRAFT_120595 [Botryobasidium botryosum FD-172 SS1]